jgi:hypothetical protein
VGTLELFMKGPCASLKGECPNRSNDPSKLQSADVKFKKEQSRVLTSFDIPKDEG